MTREKIAKLVGGVLVDAPSFYLKGKPFYCATVDVKDIFSVLVKEGYTAHIFDVGPKVRQFLANRPKVCAAMVPNSYLK